MAGAILISDKNGVSMSSIEFDHVVESIRPFLMGQHPSILEDVYNPLDEGGMDFISVQSLSHEDFNTFVDAVSAAFDREQTRDPNTEFRKIWHEILGALSADPRRSS